MAENTDTMKQENELKIFTREELSSLIVKKHEKFLDEYKDEFLRMKGEDQMKDYAKGRAAVMRDKKDILNYWAESLENEKNALLEKKGQILDAPKEIKKILGKEFIASRNFKHQLTKFENTDNPITILRYEDASRNNIILAFGNYEKNERHCVLSTVAFHKSISLISKSYRATAIRDSIVRDIKGKLIEKNNRNRIIIFFI